MLFRRNVSRMSAGAASGNGLWEPVGLAGALQAGNRGALAQAGQQIAESLGVAQPG